MAGSIDTVRDLDRSIIWSISKMMCISWDLLPLFLVLSPCLSGINIQHLHHSSICVHSSTIYNSYNFIMRCFEVILGLVLILIGGAQGQDESQVYATTLQPLVSYFADTPIRNQSTPVASLGSFAMSVAPIASAASDLGSFVPSTLADYTTMPIASVSANSMSMALSLTTPILSTVASASTTLNRPLKGTMETVSGRLTQASLATGHGGGINGTSTKAFGVSKSESVSLRKLLKFDRLQARRLHRR